MKHSIKFLSIIFIAIAMLVPRINANAMDYPTIIVDNFDTGDNWNLTAEGGSVSGGMLQMVAAKKGEYHLKAKDWSITGDYIAEVTAKFTTGTTDRIASHVGFMLKKGTDGNSYYFSGVRFPQPGSNFGIGKGIYYESSDKFIKKSVSVDLSKTCYFKFVVVGDSIEVLVRYSEDEEYTSLVNYQNDALVGGASQFGVSIWENYAHDAGINIDKVVIYNNDCISDSVKMGENKLSGCVAEPFADSIDVSFKTPMETDYYENMIVYEKGNKEAKVDVSILSSDSTSVKLGINQRLASGKEYVFSYGTQVTQAGAIFDYMGEVPFTVEADPVSIEANVSEGKLSGEVTLLEDVTEVTIIPAVYKDGTMLRMLTPVSVTAEANTFTDLDLGDVEDGCTVKLFGWNSANGTTIMCEPVIIEIGE